VSPNVLGLNGSRGVPAWDCHVLAGWLPAAHAFALIV